MNHTFGEIFKALRKEKDLIQENVAEILGVSPQSVSRWENGSSFPDITLLPQIAGYFDTTVDELLGIVKSCKMQKILFIEGKGQDRFDAVNQYLDEGWTVKELQTHSIGEGSNIQGVVLLEKHIISYLKE